MTKRNTWEAQGFLILRGYIPTTDEYLKLISLLGEAPSNLQTPPYKLKEMLPYPLHPWEKEEENENILTDFRKRGIPITVIKLNLIYKVPTW